MANKYFRKYLIPAAATETEVYLVPDANSAVIRSLRVTNTNASTSDITVIQYTLGSGTAHYLQKEKALGAASSSDVFNGIPCVLEAGDSLKVTSSTADVHFYLSYLEMDRT